MQFCLPEPLKTHWHMNKKLPLFFLGLAMFVTAYAQTIITGKVTSADTGEPVPGVTVTVKGTTVATQTDLEGNYEIEATQGQVLTFTFLGLKPEESTVGSAGTINLSMTAEEDALEQEVVVGTGEGKRGVEGKG